MTERPRAWGPRAVPFLLCLLLCLPPGGPAATPRPARADDQSLPSDARTLGLRLKQLDDLLAEGAHDRAFSMAQGILELAGRVRGASVAGDRTTGGGDRDRTLEIGALHAVRRRLAALAPEAQRAYEAHFGPVAGALLERGREHGDEQALARAARLYLFTDPGQAALDLLCDLYLESGRSSLALPWLSYRRRYVRATPEVLLREAYCLFAEGRTVDGEALARYAGADDDAVEACYRAAPARLTLDAYRYPRTSVPRTLPADLKALRVTGVDTHDLRHDQGGVSPGYMARLQVRLQPLDHPFFPLWRDGVVYYHNSVQVFARRADNGKLLWNWSPHADAVPHRDGYAGSPYGLAVAGDRLYAVLVNRDLPQFTPSGRPDPSPERFADLYCLDIRNGRLLWSTQGRDWWGETRYLARASFAGVPLVRGPMVLTPVKLGAAEVFVAAFSRTTGELLWHNFAGGEEGYRDELWRAPALEEADGAVYCVTQRGWLSAFDLGTGEVLWRRRYNDMDMYQAPSYRTGSRLRFWVAPPLVVGPPDLRTVIACPADYQRVLALSTEGRERWSPWEPLNTVPLVAGETDGVLAVSVGNRLYAVDVLAGWSKDTPWVELPGAISGTGVQAGRVFLLPRDDGLVTAELGPDRGWTLIGPRALPWKDLLPEPALGAGFQRRPGANLLWSGRDMVLAGPEGLCLFRAAD